MDIRFQKGAKRMMRAVVILAIFCLIYSPELDAQPPVLSTPPASPPPRPGEPADWGRIKEPPVKRIGRDTYQVDNILINKREKSIVLPGKVNMQEGLVELLACGRYGKLHESVLMLPVEPYYVQVALLLIGLQPGEKKLKYQGDPGLPVGDPVEIYVEWKERGRVVRKRAEELIFDKSAGRAMPHTRWVFTGSLIHDGNFMAQIEQSIVTTYHDPMTIIDNPLSGGGDDTIYFVNKEVVPPVGTPVTVIIKALRK
jgi:hypothetical protein